MKLFFRVDSATSIGAGHVMRCLALADAMRTKGVKSQFICRDFPGNLGGLIKQRGYELHLLPENREVHPSSTCEFKNWLKVHWKFDAQETSTVIEDRVGKSDWLIVDNYAFDFRWEQSLREKISNIFVIDDLANRKHDCRILLDQTLGRRLEDYQSLLNPKTMCLLGSEYALMQPAFYQRRELLEKKELPGRMRILVSLGGGDGALITERVLQTLNKIDPMLIESINIVCCKAATNYSSLVRLTEQGVHEVTLHSYVDDMAGLMVASTIAIGGPGSSSWERCCVGLPAVIIPFAKNQEQVASALESAGAAVIVNVEKVEDELPDKLIKLNQHRQSYLTTCLSVCDGLGARMVTHHFLPQRAKDGYKVTLKVANDSDIGQVYDWQCLPEVRRYARNPNPPTWDEHKQWMKLRLNDPHCYLYIIMHGVEMAGAIRLDRLDIGRYEVSLYIVPAKLRLGVARIALLLVADLHQEVEFEAEVLEGNKASHRLFLSAGYKKIEAGKYIFRASNAGPRLLC
jgi:UDP-2,4-diacetamido-2,4,6-trideoxy-beta-L-altropyranose hydrolase